MENVNNEGIIPVCIIGGGPAGIATALSLINRGIPATVIESAVSPALKIGETVPPGVKPVLRALGIEQLLENADHLPSYGNTWLWGSDRIQDRSFMNYANGNGWHLRRDSFESDLIKIARQRGAQVYSGYRLTEAERLDSGSWKLYIRNSSGDEQELFSRMLVDATGRSSKVGRINGVKRHQYDQLAGVIARFRPATKPLSQQTHIEATEKGWWYSAVLSEGEVVTVFMTDATLLEKSLQHPQGYIEALEQTHLIRNVFPEHVIPEPVTGLQIQSAGTSRLARLYGKNWIAVGDAAQSYDPISSYGITSSLGSGYYAGQAIADHFSGAEEAFPSYRHVMEKTFSDYLRLWKHQYKLEQRWNDSPFWSIRNRG